MRAFKLKSGERVGFRRDLVLIKPSEITGKFPGEAGLVMPNTTQQWVPPQQGKVVALGEEAMKVSVGDLVVYGLGCGKPVVFDQELFLIISQSEIIAKVTVH